ncbi:hypothetical protein RYX45_23015, partial [Alkalihalophilus pseudofirmus]
MEKSLNTIWIGFFKLRVFIAKSNLVKHGKQAFNFKASPPHYFQNPGVRDTRSYAHVVAAGVT